MPSQHSNALYRRHETGSRVVAVLISFLILTQHLPGICAMSRGQVAQRSPDEQRSEGSPIDSLASNASHELDLICGPHPFDLLIAGVLRSLQESSMENSLVISNTMTSLYRTQPSFYAFVMKCTSAWNRCQREQLENGLLQQLSGAESTRPTQSNDWKILCGRGLSL
ncbi:unnamed protein product [Dibothriocephalus latus]|uniref:Uncharacterized protein n=1 Tax=Dibothriocephalus latus TaxID=60516 RepID=A0A3P6PB69_DIBLA|nr:unnamed protein product [Dibothriocephalus latus]